MAILTLDMHIVGNDKKTNLHGACPTTHLRFFLLPLLLLVLLAAPECLFVFCWCSGLVDYLHIVIHCLPAYIKLASAVVIETQLVGIQVGVT